MKPRLDEAGSAWHQTSRMMDMSAVILAVASPPGRSLRGIVRMSGGQAFDVAQRTLLAEAHDEIGELPRGVHAGRVRLLASSEVPTSIVVFHAPDSYTGENSIELQLPGNPTLLERVIDRLIEMARAGGIDARRAEAGEFTARAYLNGRMSLTQAEGVAATIAAVSDAELRAAHWLASGSLGEFAHALADDLATALALVEAGIDFTDQEDVIAITPADLLQRLSQLHGRIENHLRHAVGAEQLQAIPWVVLVGEPNAGKSALFNALLGHERAVVSNVSGTTRDALAEPLAIRLPGETRAGAEVMLVDLAGLDDDQGRMNQLMQTAARQAIGRAELIVNCVPADAAKHAARTGQMSPDGLLVRTKSDLHRAEQVEGEIHVSAVTGEGLDALRAAIADRLANRAVSMAADAVALRPRHEASLRSALANLAEALLLIEPIQRERSLAYPELIASSMRGALDDLTSLAGDITPDDVLGRVFATFCVGK